MHAAPDGLPDFFLYVFQHLLPLLDAIPLFQCLEFGLLERKDDKGEVIALMTHFEFGVHGLSQQRLQAVDG